jgi:hypothetical protein
MIKAYRIQPTDKITLVAEVVSYPVAEFSWFCNDQPVDEETQLQIESTAKSENIEEAQQRSRLKIRTAGNVSTLHIQSKSRKNDKICRIKFFLNFKDPLEGIYSCTAKNPAGVSKSYGYIKIDGQLGLG